jgi:putative transport protein
MNFIVETLRRYPEISIFLTLAIGFWVGQFKYKSFSLGVVTSTLLAGVLVGQLHITISPHVKSTFFLMFLFAVGYGVGPQFFRGLKSDGIPQVFFAITLCVFCLLSAWGAGKILGYDMGLTAGLLSGASTISAVLGVATDSIKQLGLPEADTKKLLDGMPIAYAVTYLFGTAGSAWLLASLGPKLIGVNLAEACKEYEAKLSSSAGAAPKFDGESAYRALAFRSYKTARSKFVGKTVEEIEAVFAPTRVFIERVRQDGKVMEANPELRIASGSVFSIVAPNEALLARAADLGEEVDDRELMDIPAERLDVVVTKKVHDGKTIAQLAQMDMGRVGRGVYLRKLTRGGQEMPFNPGVTVQRGDVLTIVGARADVNRAADALGYPDRATEKTDMLFMGLGIVVGALIGAIVIKVGGIPLSLSTSGGALIAGLVCGWLRSVNQTFGRIPGPALWVFNNIGLNTFIAVVGISCAPGFVAGIKANGLGLFVAGMAVTTIPLILGIFVGKFIFKFHPAILFGACAGARTTTAALGAVQDEAKSKVPALGYTVTYAVGNTLLTIWGVIIVIMMK